MNYDDFRDQKENASISFDVRKDLIKKQTCFSKLNDKELEVLAALFTEQYKRAGDVIVTQGDDVDSVYLIVHGSADVQNITYNNQMPQKTSLATLSDGQAIGLNETGFYSLSGRRTATVVASSDITLLRLSVAAFNGFALSNPRVKEIMRFSAANFMGGN